MALKSKLKSKTKIALIIIICFVLAISGAMCAMVMLSSKPPQAAYDFGKEQAIGIDVSEHNKEIDWQKVSENVDFAYIRVGYRGYKSGKICLDENAKANLEGARDSGIPFGVYFYSQAITEDEAIEEARYLIRHSKKYNPKLPLIIDYEYPYDDEGKETGRLVNANFDNNQGAMIVNAFCNEIKNKGYNAGIYCSSSVARDKINMKKVPKDVTRWLAEYSDGITFDVEYDIWQYSCTESLDGVASKYVDFNYWYNNRR